MKVEKLENVRNKRGSKGCKWSSLIAPGTENPLSYPLLRFEESPLCPIVTFGQVWWHHLWKVPVIVYTPCALWMVPTIFFMPCSYLDFPAIRCVGSSGRAGCRLEVPSAEGGARDVPELVAVLKEVVNAIQGRHMVQGTCIVHVWVKFFRPLLTCSLNFWGMGPQSPFLLPQGPIIRDGDSSNFKIQRHRRVWVSGAFKLNHLQPAKPRLFLLQIFHFHTGDPILIASGFKPPVPSWVSWTAQTTLKTRVGFPHPISVARGNTYMTSAVRGEGLAKRRVVAWKGW